MQYLKEEAQNIGALALIFARSQWGMPLLMTAIFLLIVVLWFRLDGDSWLHAWLREKAKMRARKDWVARNMADDITDLLMQKWVEGKYTSHEISTYFIRLGNCLDLRDLLPKVLSGRQKLQEALKENLKAGGTMTRFKTPTIPGGPPAAVRSRRRIGAKLLTLT